MPVRGRFLICAACGRRGGNRKYCSDGCEKRPAPAVYRYVCPDGRSYVGAVGNILNRNKRGIARANDWLMEAFKQHPPETWTYEVLETLPPACSKEKLRKAEQRQIERFKSWMPEHGFNIRPAVWWGNTPGILGARKRRADQLKAWHERLRAQREEWAQRMKACVQQHAKGEVR